MSTTFAVTMATIMGLDILLIAYLAVTNPSGRLSSILLALGLASQAFVVFAHPSHTRIAISILGAILIVISMILMLPPIFTSRLRRQH